MLVNGYREPVESALVKALFETVQRFGSGRQISRLKGRLGKLVAKGRALGRTATLVALFESVLQAAVRSGASGLILIIDELGKLLEYAASHPEDGDVFVLQELAEAAARSKPPFLIVTTLHQAIDRYTQHISPSRRQEWAKVQGRFEDIAFEEPTEQMLRLLALAIEHVGPEDATKRLVAEGQKLAAEAWGLGARVGTLSENEFIQVLSAAMPLHPTVALVLSPLFRKLAQNERSLFAFLTSGEQSGFQDFLTQQHWTPTAADLYRLDHAYDYVATALGGALYTHHRGKVWAEVQSALERLREATETEMRVAKAIGLLQAIGYSAGIPASRDWLRFALRQAGESDDKLDAAIRWLEERSVVVYRRHADSYALWEGSDVDIEERIQEARRAVVDPARNMVSCLSEHAPLRPMVARRHSYRTGTLRYFDVCYADRGNLEAVLVADSGEADGRVVYCVPLNSEDRSAMTTMLTDTAQQARDTVLAAIPAEGVDVKEHCYELACLHWIERNTPELDSDATARRELRARIGSVRQALVETLGQVFLPSRERGNRRCRWFYKGEEVKLTSARELNELLSEICDGVYRHTPTWRNELVNRRELSSSAAKARRNLVEAMIEHAEEEVLGIKGTPPERSMYDSLLRATGLHRRKGEKWAFCPPGRNAETALAAIWKAVDSFLDESERGPLPVAQLFDRLHRAPFGLKAGVLPVLLGAVLLHFDNEIALYEEGTFVPLLTTPVFERITRAPERFSIQRCRIAGPRAVVFNRYAAMLSGQLGTAGQAKPKLLSVVRPLFRLVRQLPEYVGKTQQLTATAANIFRAIKEARQPDKLLFSDLPAACGLGAFSPRGRASLDQVDAFFGVLRSALVELQQAYPRLVSTIEQLTLTAFRLSPPLAQARPELSHRAKLVSGICVDPKVKGFITRVVDAVPDDATWLESLASLLAGKPSTMWGDDERARFEVNLSLTARLFHHFETLAFEMERSGRAALTKGAIHGDNGTYALAQAWG